MKLCGRMRIKWFAYIFESVCNFYSTKKVWPRHKRNTEPNNDDDHDRTAEKDVRRARPSERDANGQRKAARRFDYKIIILHFLLHGTHFSGQTKVI